MPASPNRHRRRLASGVITICLLAGVGACSSDSPSATPEASSATTSPADSGPPQTQPPTTVAPPAETAAPATMPPETTTTISNEPHLVEHAMGSTEVPGNPQRVVVLDSSFLDAAVALGVTPIAGTEGVAGRGLPAYLGSDVLGEIQLVGETTAPNLEQIAALQPDLIIGAKVRHEALYPMLSQIAPTVFSESSGTNWLDQVRLTGAALNRSAQAESLIQEFEAHATSVGEEIGAAGKTASIVRFIPGQTRLYGPDTFSGSVLTRVGFDLGDKSFDPAYSMAIISEEQITLVDADVVFATTLATDGSARPAFEALWGTLPAVQNGTQFDIADDTWMTGIGVIGANKILDDLEAWMGQ